MRGDDGQSIDEDPYAEKERLQNKFLREHPEDELSSILRLGADSQSTCVDREITNLIDDDDDDDDDVDKDDDDDDDDEDIATCPTGTVTEEMQICVVEKVLKGEWKLEKPKSLSRICPADPLPDSSPSNEPCMIQALTDTTFKSVCVDSGAGESVCPIEL